MSRTRIVFFVILTFCLAILLAALAGQASHTLLLQAYIAATIFGIGVVALDFFGLLGHQGDASGHDFAVMGGHGADAGGHDLGSAGHGADAGGHDLGSSEHAAADTGYTGHAPVDATGHGSGTEHVAAGDTHHGAAHDQAHASEGQELAFILSALIYLRLFVYFCLGFGPAGWVALASGRGPGGSLLIAVPVGVASLFLARAFFKFQRQDTGAIGPETELVGEHATVLVPLDHVTMGKVRVHAGMNITEVYALAEDPDRAFDRGEEVRVVRVTEDAVRVR